MPILVIIGMLPLGNIHYVNADDKEVGGEVAHEVINEQYYVVSTDKNIPMFEDNEGKREIYSIPNESYVIPINSDTEEEKQYRLVRYINSDKSVEIDGYVDDEFIMNKEELIEQGKLVEDKDQEGNETDSPEIESSSDDNNLDQDNEIQNNESNAVIDNQEADLNEIESIDDEGNKEKADANSDNTKTEEDVKESNSITTFSSSAMRRGENVTGIALKSPTNVRVKPSTKVNVLKTFPKDSVLKYETYSKDWYQITVEISGKEVIGYIHRKHVDNVSSNQKDVKGVAKKAPTNVRQHTTTKSKVIKKFPIGTVLEYKSFYKDWYQISVNINGKKEVGYIHKKHVTNVNTVPKDLKGVAKKSPTNIRAGVSTKSNVIKQLPIGAVIEYQSFSKNWNQISINGNDVGYIHKKHVTNVSTLPESLKAVTVKSPTNVRSGVSTKADIIKKLKVGEIIDVKTFSKNWYQITLTQNGVEETGYIHKKHAENAGNKVFQGIAKKDKTYIRTKTSTTSKALTTVPKGTILNYKLHSKNWYKVEINVNGKIRTGYIHKKHIEEATIHQVKLWGMALKSPTNVRTEASTKSKVLTTFPLDSFIQLKTFSKDWYQVDKTVNGKKVTGYIHRKHVEDINGRTFKGVAQKKTTYIRTKTSTKSSALTTVPLGTVINYQPHSVNWFKTIMIVNGTKRTGYIHKKHIGSGKTVFLDAGHGGYDPGASGNGLQEKNLTLDIAKRVQKLLESSGFIVIMSRTTDKFLSLSERTEAANKSNADIFVSVHINSGGGTGIETWKMEDGPNPTESNILASQLQDKMIEETKVANRGVKDKNLHVNRESKMPSALVEVGFIDTKKDADKLKQESFLQKAARGIARGIQSYFNIVH